jgi:hypothetical protein
MAWANFAEMLLSEAFSHEVARDRASVLESMFKFFLGLGRRVVRVRMREFMDQLLSLLAPAQNGDFGVPLGLGERLCVSAAMAHPGATIQDGTDVGRG